MKKIIAFILVMIMVFALCACGKTNDKTETPTVKMGLICLHDENSTYDLNFISAFKESCEKNHVEYMIKTNIPEGQECYDAAAELADSGCNLIFADSFGHEDYMIEAAKEFPNVDFCHATGTKAHTEGLPNYHNAFASIYQGRFLDGVAAGMKLNEMIANDEIGRNEAKVGYIGAYTYAEVISGYTGFFLGVKYVCPYATMDVKFTGSWYDEAVEKEAANVLIDNGCVIISGHADSMGAPTACEAANVPFVFYNGSLINSCPNTFIVSTRINWTPYFDYIYKCKLSGVSIDADWVGTISNGSVVMTEVNEAVAAEGTAEMIASLKDDLSVGALDVFDIRTFTVNGKKLESYMADVDTDADYMGDTEVISANTFLESTYRSAPYFDLRIDDITLLDEVY